MSENGQRPTSNVQRPTPKDGMERRAAYDLEERILAYAVRIVRLVDSLPRSRGGDHLGGQLLRSGTSPALNHGEAQAAESRNDFVHKMRICLKELRESRRTLLIILSVPLTDDAREVRSLIDETEQLIRIFFASVRSALAKQDPTARVREDAPEAVDGTWTLDVERWTLDVDQGGIEGRAI